MATRRYGASVGYVLENVVESVGAAVNANNVELTVDLSASIVTDQGTTRAISKNEVLIILEIFMQYIVRSNWTPA